MEISISAEKLFEIGGIAITNATIITLFVSATILISLILLSRKLKEIPRGFQNIIEFVIEAMLNLTDSITGDRKLSAKFFPIAITIFFFVILSNWVELIPGLSTVGLEAVHNGEKTIIPFLRSNSADLNMTIALSLITVFFIQFTGITALGLRGYLRKFFISPFHKPYLIGTFTGILELISEASKLISFSFRLFGNIFAGEVLLIVMLNLVPYIVPIPFLALEIFVGFIQAFVFSMLALVFLKISTIKAVH